MVSATISTYLHSSSDPTSRLVPGKPVVVLQAKLPAAGLDTVTLFRLMLPVLYRRYNRVTSAPACGQQQEILHLCRCCVLDVAEEKQHRMLPASQ